MGRLTNLIKGNKFKDPSTLGVKEQTVSTPGQSKRLSNILKQTMDTPSTFTKLQQATESVSQPSLPEKVTTPQPIAQVPRFPIRPLPKTDVQVSQQGTSLTDQLKPFTDRGKEINVQKQADKDRLNDLQEQIRQITLEGGSNPTESQVNQVRALSKQFMEQQAKVKPTGLGITDELAIPFTPTISDVSQDLFKASPEVIEEAKQTPQYKGGRLGANVLKNVALYSTVGGALEGTKLGTNLAGKLGGTKLGQALTKIPTVGTEQAGTLLATQATDLLADSIIQRPQEVIRNLQEGNNWDEGLAVNTLIDLGLNLVIGGAVEGTQILKSLRKSNPSAFKSGLNNLTPQQAKAVNDAIGKPVDTVVDSVDKPIIEATKPQKLSDVLKQEPTMAAKIETPEIDENTLIVNLPTIAKGEPIDTKSLVTTELPKKPKQTLSEKYDRAVQELIGKYDFLGKVSDKAKVQSSNINRTLGTIENSVIKGGNQTNMLGEPVGKSVVDIFENVKKEDTQDLFEYIFHKHNIDRAAEGKPVFGDTIDSDFSKKFVQDFEANNPDALQVQQDITGYFRNLLNEWAVPSGLTSQETAAFLNDLYKNYVPTTRVKNMPKAIGQGNQVVAQILKKAKGGDDAILPLDQMMIMQTERIVKNARKNEMLNTLADAFEAGEGNVSKRVFEIKGGEKEILDDAFDIGKNLEVEPQQIGDNYAINFYRNGEPRQMIVDKVTYEAFKPQNFDNMVNKTSQVIKKYATNPFKSLITEYNPAFSIANVMRDIPTAITFSDNAINMIKSVPDAVKEMLTNGDKFKQFKALGGTREGLIGAGKEFKVPKVTDKTALQTVGDQVKKLNPFKYVSDINKFTETLPRFSEYLAVLEKTGDPALAIYKSADLTTDFAKHGNTTKLVDSFVPYLNPQVQGMNKFYRALRDNPIKTAIGAGASITVPTMILDQVNKDDEAYNNLSPRERNLYFQIPYTDENEERQFIRIPKSRELGVAFSSIYDWAARKARGEEVTGEEVAQAIEENFGVGITPLWEPAVKAFNQIKDPDAYETNYWGGLIVPQSQRKYSPGEQYDLNSSGIAKAIGEQFGISPYVVDYLIDSYTGVAADIIQPIGADRKTGFDDPLTKRFKTDPVMKSDASNLFYSLLDEKKKEAQDVNKQKLKLDPLYDSRSEVTPEEEEANALNKLAQELSELRKQQKLLQREKGNEDKIRELQKAINKLAEEAVRSYK